MLPTKKPGYTITILGLAACSARVNEEPTVNIKLINSQQNAI
jgi:hypothetical protein